ncbi:hypothetical protein O4J56_04865 [Nocardiopsis sp. RSe5-2]|uniref:Integral membrane protein n=1 Tax=Nocardiopsis endophytica TaxID=3018445 RepID=A0ABT4U0G0_9ACTN|nr:hypothetical protein [Nocardiopsis endophytica]MDA2809960.1 hypothetical protein [Nocardiopsis endophytica]
MDETGNRAVRRRARWATSGGLLLCAAGIAALWLSGAEFPVALPPGGGNTDSSSRSEIVFLLIAALFIALARWRWAPAVGALFGAVFTLGFAATPAGLDNLLGGSGAGIAAAQAVQVVGEAMALVAGVVAVVGNYRTGVPAPEPRR